MLLKYFYKFSLIQSSRFKTAVRYMVSHLARRVTLTCVIPY